ncbi:MAG TPA: hypothetical protein VK699_14830 [Terriglobales bacterium]|jgi:hypothetical protein|nr:hypothetical protein [Terriglobales bacterium]
MSVWFRFILAVLATWRVTHLLAREDGPADLIARFRALLGRSLAGKLMDCFHCLSLWIAIPAALFVSRQWSDGLMVWVALSGAACLLERLGRDPIVMEPISQLEQQGDDHVLRSETSRVAKQSHFNHDAGKHTACL